MIETIRDFLVDVARRQKVTCYTEVGNLVGLSMSDDGDRYRLAEILGIISSNEHDEGRPLLSAVVVGAEDGRPASIPGRGFYTLAKGLGFDVSDEMMMFVHELRRVHDYWGAK